MRALRLVLGATGAIAAAVQQELIGPESKVIDTNKLQALISEKNLWNGAQQLYVAANASIPDEGHPTRAIGTAGHNATLEYIWDELDALGDYYTLEAQRFVALSGRVFNYSLSDATSGKPIAARPLRMTPATSVGGVEAEVMRIPGSGCLNSDFSDRVHGRIALVQRGHCTFGEKAEAAGQFGALGVLLWDPEAGSDELISAELGTPFGHEVATVFVTREWAETVDESTRVLLTVDAQVLEVPTTNIIAETRGGDHDNVVMLGAHSDSVPAGAGINDNGSGTITLLEVARQLANFEVTNAVRFAWWSAEELGLRGSLYYTENILPHDAQKIRLFMDYDMMASPNYVYEVYDSEDAHGENPAGSAALRDMYEDWYESHGHSWVSQPFDGRSDYVGFLEIGIPASGIDAGAEGIKTADEAAKFGGHAGNAYDECYHASCDTPSNLNMDAWLTNSRLVAHSVARYARSLEGFPARSQGYKIDGAKIRREYILS